MTDLRLDTWTMPSADVGEANPFPPIQGDASLAKSADLTEATAEMRERARYGRVASIAPYLLQDGYSRERRAHGHRVAIMENEHLTAAFLLDLGGRLWSLRDNATGRELLYTNPVFQPANLALRNAWFAGGVEWNIGTIGHTPLTCAPLHAARVSDDDGTPVLRLYEFERLRRVVYQFDVHLPPSSRALYVHVRIANPNDTTVPTYWWSNIAVPQDVSTRVFAPADYAWNYSYDNVLRHDPVAPADAGSAAPGYDDVPDISYPARFAAAADFFFDLAGADQPWIAALGADGAGLYQTSTANLVGRKLFRWGTGTGGRRWQGWLSGRQDDPAGGYAEIQAGLATTQFEHLPMPPRTDWSWTEAYGPLTVDPEIAHGPWQAGRPAVERAVLSAVSSDALAQLHAHAAEIAGRAPEVVLHHGSGWGALERRLRAAAGEPSADRPGTPFGDETLGEEQRPWLDLLSTGVYADPGAGALPRSVHLHPVITDALTRSSGWAAPALLGVARAAAGDWDGARAAWLLSVARFDNAYARRNLAVSAQRAGDADGMVGHYRAALSVLEGAKPYDLPAHRALAAEAVTALTGAEAHRDAMNLLGALPAEVRRSGRIRFLEARAALGIGDIDRCEAILDDPALEVADLREGEDSLDELWFGCRAARRGAERGIDPGDETGWAALRAEVERREALPAHLDFRMKPGEAG